MINFENIEVDSIENMVKSVEVNGKSFSWYFQEIIGIKHLTLGDTKKANSIFTSLSLDKDTPFDLKIRLDKLIQIAN